MKGKNGGKRVGAGRKSKAAELEILAFIDSVWTLKDKQTSLRKTVEAANEGDLDAFKLLMAYRFGKPKDSLDVTSNGETIFSRVIEPKTNDGNG